MRFKHKPVWQFAHQAPTAASGRAVSYSVGLVWVGGRHSLRPDEGQLQLSKPMLTVPLPASLSALPKRSQGFQHVFRLTESLWRIKIAHDPLVRVR
jgi:hypothetical protein